MPESLLRPLSEHELRSYDRDGAVMLRGLFGPHWVERLNGAIERLRRKPGPLGEIYGGADGYGGFYGDRFM